MGDDSAGGLTNEGLVKKGTKLVLCTNCCVQFTPTHGNQKRCVECRVACSSSSSLSGLTPKISEKRNNEVISPLANASSRPRRNSVSDLANYDVSFIEDMTQEELKSEFKLLLTVATQSNFDFEQEVESAKKALKLQYDEE